MKRFLLPLALVLGAVAIYFAVSGASENSSEEAESSSAAASGSEASSSEGLREPSRARGERRDPIRASAASDGEEVGRYYRDNGSEVRDHRGAGAAEPQLKSHGKPVAASPVKPVTVAQVRTSLRPAMKDCMDRFRDQAEAGAKAQAVLDVEITEGVLRITDVQVQSSGVSAHEELTECVKNAMLGHEESAGVSEDVASHKLTFPYSF